MDYPISIMKRNAGLTLVEVIVAGVVVSILFGVLLSIFAFYTKAANEGTANTRLRMITNAILEDIAVNVRKATSILSDGGNGIKLCGSTSSLIHCYRINGTVNEGFYLEESSAQISCGAIPTDYKKVHIGFDSVKIQNCNNAFNISSDQKSFSFASCANILFNYGSDEYTISLNGATFHCRN